MDSISVKGGGDTAEDVIGGLRVVLNPSHIKWISDPYGTKVGRILNMCMLCLHLKINHIPLATQCSYVAEATSFLVHVPTVWESNDDSETALSI